MGNCCRLLFKSKKNTTGDSSLTSKLLDEDYIRTTMNNKDLYELNQNLLNDPLIKKTERSNHILNQFKKIKLLGTGTFGEVFLVKKEPRAASTLQRKSKQAKPNSMKPAKPIHARTLKRKVHKRSKSNEMTRVIFYKRRANRETDSGYFKPGSETPESRKLEEIFLEFGLYNDYLNSKRHEPKRTVSNETDPLEFKRSKTFVNFDAVLNQALNESKASVVDQLDLSVVSKSCFRRSLVKRKEKLYAMKILSKEFIKLKAQEDHTKSERKILEMIQSPFIVQLQYAFQTPKDLYIVTEFVQGGELLYHIQREFNFTESRAKFYLAEIALALDAVHSSNCIYRDLKPENVLIDKDGHIKLTDFGLSKIMPKDVEKDDRAFTICGTPGYLAPEILFEEGYDKSVDFWSLGILFYQMIEGHSPLKGLNFKEKSEDFKEEKGKKKKSSLSAKVTKTCLLRGLSGIKYSNRFSKLGEKFTRRLLESDPGKRIKSLEEIKQDPYFSQMDWSRLMRKEISPEFIPNIIDEYDVQNFDKMFTEEPFNYSWNNTGTWIDGMHYEDFSYVNPHASIRKI